PTLALGGALSAVGNLWCAEASGFPEFLLARFVAGAGAGFVVTGGHVVLADISTPERRGRMMAVYQGVFLFAVGLGPLPGGWLAQHYGLDAPFHAYAIAGTLVSALAFLAVPETRDFRDQRAVLGGKRPAHLAQLKALFSQTGFLLVSLVMFVNAFTRTGGLFNVVPVLGVERLGLSTTQIGFGLALGSLGGLVVTYPAGTLADRYGRKSVIVPSTVIMALSYFMYCLAPSYAWFLAACVAWGTAASVAGAAPAAYAVDSAPPGMNAAAVSSFRLLSDLGYVIGPIVMGLMVDFHSAEFALTASSIALLLIGLTFALKAPETYSGWRRSDR
ncbi:MAG: MFS transporter, partial [Gammaproteobacteria bacterium]|nr:MFS transporter [Gammaproteobacteria bacterium]